MMKIEVMNNLNSFKKGLGKVASIDVERASDAVQGDLGSVVARSERVKGMASLCASCKDGYSKFSDEPNLCKKECQEGCDICSSSNDGECVKCDFWRGYYEVAVSQSGFVECRFWGVVFGAWGVFGLVGFGLL